MRRKKWMPNNQPISKVLNSLKTSPEGLTHAQITEKLE